MKKNSSKSQLKMSLGSQLILGLFFVSSLLILLIAIAVRVQMNRSGAMLTAATQSHLVAASHSLVNFVSIEELDLYHTTEDTETKEYEALKQRLITFAEGNNLLFAYYWRAYGNNKLQYIVDNDLDPEEKVGPWEITDLSEKIAIDALSGTTGVTDLKTITPTWDGYITAYTPVYDREGNIYCVAGVDVSQENLFIQRRDSQRMTLLMLIAIPLSIVSGVLNVLLYRRRARQMQESSMKLAQESSIIQTMKDNIHQGIFLMNVEYKILPQYSQPLISILSYYDSELAGKSFLDILATSLDSKQLQTMQGYFAMVFSKSKSAKVLESANPISEFVYKAGDSIKTLTTRFNLIEQASSEPMIIGIVQDITKEKAFEMELQTQKQAQELEMKNLFDVIQIDPLVFQDFIEDTETNFNYINAILKDRSLTEKQVVTKFFQNVHAMKSNALILGLETFGKKLHFLEDEIKKISSQDEISVEDILGLAMGLEIIMQEKDSYLKVIKRIERFKNSNQLDSVLVHSLTKAVERVSEETQKKVDLKTGQIDLSILESKLRKPIKDILFQCVRNSIYHGIETVDERLKKNKKPQGLLLVNIRKINNKVEVTFSDDGCGLNWDKIKVKYLKLYPEAKDISRKELLSSIFRPEFSTSEEVSSVAGRGVGLSLVKDLVKENNGTIGISSTESGLTFKFCFPLPA